MKVRLCSILGSISLFLLPGAFGQVPTDAWSFRGVLTSGLANGAYPAGMPYSFDFALDPTRLSLNSDGLYFPTLGYSFIVGCCGFGGSSLGAGVLIANDRPINGGGSFDGIVFGLKDQVNGFPSGIQFDGSATGITLVRHSPGASGGPFNSSGFPTTLDLNEFDQRYLTLPFESGVVLGSVDSFYINGVLMSQVPEPSGLSFLALGALGSFIAARRAAQQRKVADQSPANTPGS